MSDEDLLRRLNEEARQLANNVGAPLRRLRLRLGSAAVDMEWGPETPPTAAEVAAPAAGPAPAPEAAEKEDLVVVRAPMVGTFYHAPAPGEPPFVSVGGTVDADTVIGIVEAMKLMNQITADQSGVVRDVLAADGHPVEFEQPLLLLDPLPDQDRGDR